MAAKAEGPLAGLRNNPKFASVRAQVQQQPDLLIPLMKVSHSRRTWP